jgi:hypothetical protein
MALNKTELENLGFAYAGQINRDSDDGRLSILLNEYGKSKHEGWVYVWVKVLEPDRFDVCYIGKAGKTFWARCGQHIGGLRGGSKRGSILAGYIDTWLSKSSDRKIHVYARQSSIQEVLKESDISMCEAEERAMIQKMRRLSAELWNIV